MSRDDADPTTRSTDEGPAELPLRTSIIPRFSEYFERTAKASRITSLIMADLDSGPLAHVWMRFTSEAQLQIRERWRTIIESQL